MMILAAPLMLLGLLVLPLLWWLLRAVPPAPRPQPFPAIRLLAGLQATRQEALRAPPWLLLLRLLAGALLVFGLAQPVLVQQGSIAPASRNLLIVLDDGWAAAVDWPLRIAALDVLLDRAGRAGQLVRLLSTAADESGTIRPPGAPVRPAQLRAEIDARRPRSWNTDRAAAARVLDQVAADAGGRVGSIVYLSDGVATGGDAALAATLHRLGPAREWHADPQRLRLLLPPVSTADGLTARVGALPQAAARPFTVQAEDAEGGTLARVDGTIPAGAEQGQARIVLPVELRNRIARLVLDGAAGPAGLRLLDEGDRRRPVGLIATGSFTDAPLLGPLFYLRRALALDTELRTGDVASLLSRQLSVLIAPDGTLDDARVRQRVTDWVRGGGMLIRFAGPVLAAAEQAGPTSPPDQGPADQAPADPASPDPAGEPAADAVARTLLPAPLLEGARTLGGAMSWSRPAHLARFGADTPFAGLDAPSDVTVSRQVLARPSIDLDARSWARLSDGTPLVTHAALGAGQVVLFHVTSTSDWSTLPFSGLFVQMLHRLVQRSAGLSTQGGDAVLAPVSTLDGDGVAGAPPPSARALAAREFGRTAASAQHPPGLYGPPSDRRALNAGDALPPLAASASFGAASDLAGRVPDRPLGPPLLAAALVLLAIELVATLWLRGLLRPIPGQAGRRAARSAPVLLLVGGLLLAAALAASASARAEDAPPAAALQTRLGYVVTGDAQTDNVSRAGLEGLSNYVNARTSASLGHPDAVHPGQDDLAFYPLLYWPIIQGAAADPGAISALNAYMNRGGILLIDTRGSDTGGGSFTGLATTGPQALRQATAGLDIPPLAPVDSSNVLSHSFYLLHAFPGRYVGAPVWVAATGEPGRDNVSPLIIGANDWASAWAIDAAGDTPYAVIPGGERQRTLAYRFGVNAVIYALTGNYKSDQVHVPALLQRLGE